MPQGLPLLKPPYSRMTAIDLNTGEHAWWVPTGNGDRYRNHPRLRHLNLPPLGGDNGSNGPAADEDAAHLLPDRRRHQQRPAVGGLRQDRRDGAGVGRPAVGGDWDADDLHG